MSRLGVLFHTRNHPAEGDDLSDAVLGPLFGGGFLSRDGSQEDRKGV